MLAHANNTSVYTLIIFVPNRCNVCVNTHSKGRNGCSFRRNLLYVHSIGLTHISTIICNSRIYSHLFYDMVRQASTIRCADFFNTCNAICRYGLHETHLILQLVCNHGLVTIMTLISFAIYTRRIATRLLFQCDFKCACTVSCFFGMDIKRAGSLVFDIVWHNWLSLFESMRPMKFLFLHFLHIFYFI